MSLEISPSSVLSSSSLPDGARRELSTPKHLPDCIPLAMIVNSYTPEPDK